LNVTTIPGLYVAVETHAAAKLVKATPGVIAAVAGTLTAKVRNTEMSIALSGAPKLRAVIPSP
jgi:hypothetical protein